MENSLLFFSCAYKSEEGEWITLADRDMASKIGKDKILFMLNSTKNHRSDVRLEVIPEPEVGLSELRMESDGERYLFTLLEYGDNGEFLIRSKSDFTGVPRLVDFMGEPFPASEVITDFDFIKDIFIELLETGNVSYELMDI